MPVKTTVSFRDLALFNKLRGCDLVRLKVFDVFAAGRVKERTSVFQSKTGKPVQFENADSAMQLSASCRLCVTWTSGEMRDGLLELARSAFHRRTA